MIKAAIFDFDGTLVDLFDIHLAAFQVVARKYFNLEFTRADLDAGYGMVGRDIMMLFLSRHGLSPDEAVVKKAVEERRDLVAENIGGGISLLPGAGELLKSLKKAGFKVGIATSCSKRICELVFALPLFDGLLDAITMGTEVARGKPDPEIYLETAKRLGVKPEECVVFEDSVHGVRAGKAAGMRVIAVTTGHDGRESLLAERPDRIVASMKEVSVDDVRSLS
ncbi:MAG: HAD family phosphatase [Candidatus Altiarchaeota archaeon]|nr:HAD family phosphatase [Candidatus Altiarchaeota archaeon]